MLARRFTLRGDAGRELPAWLELPADEKPVAYAILTHRDLATDPPAPSIIARALNRARIALLCIEPTGLGDGAADATSLSTAADDIVAAAEFLASERLPPRILIGQREGGTASVLAAARIPSVAAITSIGAPHDPAHDDTLRSLDRALLILHSPVDEAVDIQHAARIYTAARHPKSFVSLDGADHLLSDERDADYVGCVIAAWVGRYLEAPAAETLEELVEADRVVVRTGRSGYRTEIAAGGHILVADEPGAVGGTDAGPSPYEYLAAALGACTSMTLRMYADRKGWPLEQIVVRLRHRKVHALDERRCETERVRLDELRREIELDGDLDDAQRTRLAEIADRCPVHRTFEAGIRVTTELRAPRADP